MIHKDSSTAQLIYIDFITGIEGSIEGSLQLVLQLFIIFNRADRQPTLLQLLTLATSLLSIMNAKVDSMFADKPESPFMEKVKFWPYALLFAIQNWVTMPFIISTIQWNFIWTGAALPVVSRLVLPVSKLIGTCIGLVIGFLVSLICCPCMCIYEICKTSDKEETSEAIPDKKRCSEAISERQKISEAISDKDESSNSIFDREAISDKQEQSVVIFDKQEMFEVLQFLKTASPFFSLFLLLLSEGVFYSTIVLVVIAVLVNFYPETWIWNLWAQGYKLSDVAIVSSGYVNIVFGSCISSGILFVVLHYFQVIKPVLDKQAKIEEEGEET